MSVTSVSTPIFNRLQKNIAQLKPWAERLQIEAFRVYDRDIPEYPSIIEIYGSHVVLWDRRNEELDRDKQENFDQTLQALTDVGFSAANIHIKRRDKQRPRAARGPIQAATQPAIQPTNTQSPIVPAKPIVPSSAPSAAQAADYVPPHVKMSHEFLIREGDMKFLVNLHDYLDTGLFLDHRLTRKMVYDEISNRRKKAGPALSKINVLNLFSYTGSFSVYAAKAGATVTSVDMSPTYLEWSERNLIANGLNTSNHRFINDDVLSWMKDGFGTSTGPYDFVICDPPTFSNSKKMEGTWDVARDHRWLIQKCLECVKPGGTLIFSANRRDFRLDPDLDHLAPGPIKDITKETLPKDFRDLKIRKVFRFYS